MLRLLTIDLVDLFPLSTEVFLSGDQVSSGSCFNCTNVAAFNWPSFSRHQMLPASAGAIHLPLQHLVSEQDSFHNAHDPYERSVRLTVLLWSGFPSQIAARPHRLRPEVGGRLLLKLFRSPHDCTSVAPRSLCSSRLPRHQHFLARARSAPPLQKSRFRLFLSLPVVQREYARLPGHLSPRESHIRPYSRVR